MDFGEVTPSQKVKNIKIFFQIEEDNRVSEGLDPLIALGFVILNIELKHCAFSHQYKAIHVGRGP